MQKENKKDLHKKHRMRVRNEFLEYGFNDTTPSHKVLEMLLFYSIPRKDTNDIAHELLNRFGSIKNVLEATNQELKEIDGIGDNTVAMFKLLLHIIRDYRSNKKISEEGLNTIDGVYEYITERYIGFNKEIFGIGTFNSRGEFIGFDFVKSGDVSSVGVSVREVLEAVFKHNATTVILVHNHPGGIAVPSYDDINLTQKLFTALKHVNVYLYDHIIIADNDYISFRQTVNLKDIFKRENKI